MHSGKSRDVLVWTTPEDSEKGTLRIGREELIIELESGEVLSSGMESNTQFSIRPDGHNLDERVRLRHSFVVFRPYAPRAGQVVETVFPLSTSGFYGRTRIGEDEAVFIVHEIIGSSKSLLVIGSPRTKEIFDIISIYPYETEALRLYDRFEILRLWDETLWDEDAKAAKENILGVLDEPSLTWTELEELVEDVSIPDLRLGKSVRETLTQLVPSSFPDDVRNELMAFLAFISKGITISEDPIDHYFRTYSLRMFGALMRGHLRCVTDNVPWPPYVKLMIQAARGHLQYPKRALEEQSQKTSWRIFWDNVFELFPSWLNIAIDSAIELSKARNPVLRLPSTKSLAKRSLKHWKRRLAALTYGLRIQGEVNTSVVGLSELLYIGAAYRWPHRHMRFIAMLGPISEGSQHLQVMTMPQSSVERVKRFLPSSMKISWSTRVVNLELYDAETGNWNFPTHRFWESISKQSTLKKLNNRFGSKKNTEQYQMSFDDATVAGLIADGIYLSDFENPHYLDYWGLSKRKFQSCLSNLVRRNVVNLYYGVFDAHVSVATIVQGNAKHLTSLAHAFLSCTPTSLALLNDTGDRGVFLSRMTEESALEIVSRLPEQGLENGLTIRCMRPTSFRSYTFDLYHRLLRNDGTWDDDVSAFLSQARSKRKELSESNA
ncbi:MAG: hypothetical protein ACFFFK_09020 [Candidatus Thorarchaeota archaeon]